MSGVRLALNGLCVEELLAARLGATEDAAVCGGLADLATALHGANTLQVGLTSSCVLRINATAHARVSVCLCVYSSRRRQVLCSAFYVNRFFYLPHLASHA